MTAHRYRVAQRVSYVAPHIPSAPGGYEIVDLMPPGLDGEPQYRIKSTSEVHERIATESQLAPHRS